MTKSNSCLKRFAKLDSFGFQVPLYYHEANTKMQTGCGAFMTILIFIVVVAYFSNSLLYAQDTAN